jgi:beta-lactamase class A
MNGTHDLLPPNVTTQPRRLLSLTFWNGWLMDGSCLNIYRRYYLETMSKTSAFPGRLRAGLPTGWLIVDKSAGLTSKGAPGAANDVGILMAPDVRSFVVAG